jgi:alpha-D-ribose 1-methylphosphonate 5-triphosphate synthase subunit PhnL
MRAQKYARGIEISEMAWPIAPSPFSGREEIQLYRILQHFHVDH